MRYVVSIVAMVLLVGCGHVEAQCKVAADCHDPSAPFCVDDKCVATCGTSADCSDPTRSVCASDGACVGCVTASDCSGAAPVCDTQTRACRSCGKDSECANGVCVEAEGTCVGDADVAYVTMMGNDAGTCTRTAPCATIPFAIAQAGNRRVIHVLGGTLAVAPNLNITGDRVLDGEDTALSAGGTAITITAPANVTVEGFQLAAPASNMLPAINITGVGAKAVLDHIQVTGNATSLVTAGNSTDVTIQNSHFGSLTTGTNQVACSNGKMRVDRCVLETTFIGPSSGTCELIVTRNRFESNRDRSVQLTQGHLVMENNLIIHRDGFNDSISVGVLGPGSTIRFNTIVNTTALPSDGAALNCDNSVEITSNIFAYNSGHPIVGIGCSTRFSVFDDQATTAAGTGNKVTGIDTIFVNRAAGDYHLATGSVARGGAEPGLSMVTGDFEGSPRPNPAGSTADCGAFEAP